MGTDALQSLPLSPYLTRALLSPLIPPLIPPPPRPPSQPSPRAWPIQRADPSRSAVPVVWWSTFASGHKKIPKKNATGAHKTARLPASVTYPGHPPRGLQRNPQCPDAVGAAGLYCGLVRAVDQVARPGCPPKRGGKVGPANRAHHRIANRIANRIASTSQHPTDTNPKTNMTVHMTYGVCGVYR